MSGKGPLYPIRNVHIILAGKPEVSKSLGLLIDWRINITLDFRVETVFM